MVCACVCKCTIGIINSLFLLVGILVTALGGILIAITNNAGFANTIEDYIKKIIETIGAVNKDGAQALDNIDFVGLLQPAALGIFFCGIGILCIAVIGYCGISCYTTILWVYMIIIIVILAAQVVIVAVFFSGSFDNDVRTQITRVIDDEYGGITDPSIFSVIPNILMINFQCCGLDGYGDFNSSTRWNRNVSVLITPPGVDPEVYEYRHLKTPIACCKTNGTFPSVTILDQNCATAPTDDISNWKIGCWGEITSFLSPYRTYSILICVAIMLIQAAIIAGVLFIVCEDSD